MLKKKILIQKHTKYAERKNISKYEMMRHLRVPIILGMTKTYLQDFGIHVATSASKRVKSRI